MGSTGLLPYVHGIDFSFNDFTDQTFQGRLGQLQSLRWVNLDNMKLCKLPNDLFKLHKLEYLSVANNQLLSIHGDLSNLRALRSINFSRNRLKNYGVPSDLFALRDLSVVDLSHNELVDTPHNLGDASSLLILNLSHNNIQTISGDVFKSLIGLVYLNLSDNQFENIPPQLRRLLNLKVLILSGNPLAQSHLRQLVGLRSLQTLELRSTFRNDLNLPPKLSQLSNLTKIDLSHNELTHIPDCLHSLTQLLHINLSNNVIDSLTFESFPNLEYLNLSRNRLTLLPSCIFKLSLLHTLYLSGNSLDQTGLPSGMHRLVSLTHLNLSSNNFESLPDSLFRCKRLRRLNVADNQLRTLPIAFHRRRDITIDYSSNPDLVLPPRPVVEKSVMDPAHGIDFSLTAQLKASGVLSVKSSEVKLTGKELLSKRLKLLCKKEAETDHSSEMVLEGMKKTARMSFNIPHVEETPKKRWDENLERPNIDYSNIFEPHVGQHGGLIIFEMSEFYPVELHPDLYGHFFLGDCYVILSTSIGEKGELSHEIYYLIGPDSAIDKKTAAAMHSVHLRNFLNASSRTHREEMGDESEELTELMQREGVPLTHVDGEHALTGLFSSVADSVSSSNKCYMLLLHETRPRAIPMPMSAALLIERQGIYLVESEGVISIFTPHKCSDFVISKAGLVGENVNRHEHKSSARVEIVREGEDNPTFWEMFDDREYNAEEVDLLIDHKHKLYQVNFNKRFLELPQAGTGRRPLQRGLLNTNNVYILDTICVIYIWRGKKAPILLCNAGLKLSEELFLMIPRPKHSSIKFFKEGDESLFFKSCFGDWESLLSLGSVGRSMPLEVNPEEEGDKGHMKNDISALFLPRRPDFTADECESLILDYQDNCELLIAYVYDRRKYVGLPKEHYGHFHDDMCYLFICNVVNVVNDVEELSYQAYFWEGVRAPVGGWLQFMLSLRPTIETTLKTTLDIIRLQQQKEDLRFMALFNRRFVIHSTDDAHNRMFVLRATSGSITLRCIQVDVNPHNLNSHLCCLLVVPFDCQGDVTGIVYVWVGLESDPREADIAEDIALQYYGTRGFAVNVVGEGSEPYDYFWDTFGETTDNYDKEGYFLSNLRLFRAFTDNECFMVVEKYTDFSRNDLSDRFPMILDDTRHVFVWLPKGVNNTDVRLALHSSSVYIKHLARVDSARPRKLVIQRQDKEAWEFKRCFHGWSL